MKAHTLFILLGLGLNNSLSAQDSSSISKKIPQATLPYITGNEFLDIELFESKIDFAKNGLLPLSETEAQLLVDESIDPLSDHYFGVHRIQLSPKIIGVIYYKQSIIDGDETSAYNFLITTYSISGKKMATTDFIGYEWLEEENLDNEEEFEEEEELDEMEQEFEEITFFEEDTLGMEEFEDGEMINNYVDEGYTYSTISLKNNEIWIERKSISYYSKEILATSYLKLNTITGEFDEME